MSYKTRPNPGPQMSYYWLRAGLMAEPEPGGRVAARGCVARRPSPCVGVSVGGRRAWRTSAEPRRGARRTRDSHYSARLSHMSRRRRASTVVEGFARVRLSVLSRCTVRASISEVTGLQVRRRARRHTLDLHIHTSTHDMLTTTEEPVHTKLAHAREPATMFQRTYQAP
jgi:hypothetical protein